MLTKSDIEQYFLAEKTGGMQMLCIGIAAILIAAICYFTVKNNWTYGFIIPLMVVGFIQIAVGFTVYNKSDDDRKNMVYSYDLRPEKLRNEDLPRMEKVSKLFLVLKYVELIMMAIAVIIILFYSSNQSKTFWVGLAMGLLIQATVSFLADVVAEKRGKISLEKLRKF